MAITTHATILAQLPTWKDMHARDFAMQRTAFAQLGYAKSTIAQSTAVVELTVPASHTPAAILVKLTTVHATAMAAT